jgi:hypothetical protein
VFDDSVDGVHGFCIRLTYCIVKQTHSILLTCLHSPTRVVAVLSPPAGSDVHRNSHVQPSAPRLLEPWRDLT